MSRSRLSLFQLDREALASFSGELLAALLADDKEALVRLLGLEGASAEAVRSSPRAVFVMLAAEAYPASAAVFRESLRSEDLLFPRQIQNH